MSGFVRLAEGILFWQVQEKQGERGDFHRGSFSRNLGSGGDGTIPAVRYFSYFPKNRATWRNLDWSGRLLLLVTMHCCGFSDAVSGE